MHSDLHPSLSPHARALLAGLPPPLPPPEIDPDCLDPDSLRVVARLRRHGYAAYLVGGCVRDVLAGVRPKDWDVATSARPDEIRDVFRNSRLIGRRFRLAHVYFPGGRLVEVATFRSDPLPAADGDEDDLLVVEDNEYGTAEEDARRRDFTVNGLFYDVEEGRVIDYVGGRADLAARRIRTIGDPEIRLREDPVRGLRAARIAAKLGFAVDAATLDAMARHAGELPRCAAARVLDETLKLLRCGASRAAFGTLRRAGILRVLLPPVDDVLSRGGADLEAEFYERLAALDALVREGRPVTDSVMLAAVLSFLPLHDEVAREDQEPDEPQENGGESEEEEGPPCASEVLAQMSQTARLPRRVADRVRAVVGAQHFLLQPPRRRRRRGGSRFVHAPHFPEALLLLEILVRSTGRHAESLDRWRRRAEDAAAADVPPDEAPAPLDETNAGPALPPGEAPAAEAVPTRRKRHRGGRRHRRAGHGAEATSGGEGAEGASGSAAAEPAEPSESGPGESGA